MEVFNTVETAKFLGCKESTLRNWRSAGTGPAFHRISARKVVYDGPDLQKWKSERRVVPSMPKEHPG